GDDAGVGQWGGGVVVGDGVGVADGARGVGGRGEGVGAVGGHGQGAHTVGDRAGVGDTQCGGGGFDVGVVGQHVAAQWAGILVDSHDVVHRDGGVVDRVDGDGDGGGVGVGQAVVEFVGECGGAVEVGGG